METRVRTIVKTVSYRIVGTFVTAGVVWMFTHRLEFAATVGLIDTLSKLGVYYLHERAWDRVPFGRLTAAPLEYEI